MNLLEKKWINRGDLKVDYNEKEIIIENNKNNHQFLIYPKIFRNNKNKEIYFDFKGKVISGSGCQIKVLNRHKTILATCGLNSVFSKHYDYLKYYLIVLHIPANSKIKITKLDYQEKIIHEIEDMVDFKNDTLLITPGYPSFENKYNTAFVHTRMLAYKNSGYNVDLIVCNSLPDKYTYSFEEIDVLKTDFFGLRTILQKKKYKNIIVHFFDEQYANVLDSVDITETNLFFYMHGADILYRDFPEYASRYFEGKLDVVDNERIYRVKDSVFIKYNNLKNVKWMFVSEFVKNRAEKLLNLKFNNYDIIPCFIDNNFFEFEEKNPELRKKIFILRRFTNDSCYAIDIDIRTILELSKRDCFKDLVFDIYGDGEMFDILINPVKDFPNVHLHRGFLTHEEIKKMQHEHGIGLFASRFDTQGVSLCEAISSGCSVVTSKVEGINAYINDSIGVTCDIENYVAYADVIEKMYNDVSFYKKTIKELYKSVNERFNYDKTIKKELDIFKNTNNYCLELKNIKEKPVLSIIVPSYNVEKYLESGIATLINHRNAHKMEILIVNDGSKDSTSEIGKKLEKKTTINGNSIVKLIDKENGGHGSTINVGIRKASGKYLKVMDGDDTVDSERLADLIDILENENTDIILNDYIEDWAQDNEIIYKCTYPFMTPGMEYNFEDLCYDGYGFDLWGPILSCSTYRTEMLKKANFYLSEKSFYVDMELNTYIAIACKTIKYYPMYIYRYLLGRANQSVTKASYMKNVKHHEKVTINMINILENNKNNISQLKIHYIINKLILTMIRTQYIIVVQFYNSGKYFREFEKKLKQYKNLYNNETIATRGIKFHRLTNGRLIFMHSFLIKVFRLIKKFFN